MVKKVICVLSTLCMISCMPVNAGAETLPISEVNSANNAAVYSAGLINRYDVSISSSGNTIYLSGSTGCTSTMKSIGFKSIKIQRSSNGTSWSDYCTVSDILNSSAKQCTLSSKNLGTVPKGYYYRVTCTHYAKETGLFGSSESLSNTSNAVYIS